MMQQAKASPEDIEGVEDFFRIVEEAVQRGFDEKHLGKLVGRLWRKVAGARWRRVVHCCEMCIKNCCDPALDYLEWRPDVKAFLEAKADA